MKNESGILKQLSLINFLDVEKPPAEGNCKYIDVRGSSLLESHDTEATDDSFDFNHPNGSYCLNLGDASHVMVAKQLVSLARAQGARTWKKAKLNGQPLHLATLASSNKQTRPLCRVMHLNFKLCGCTAQERKLDHSRRRDTHTSVCIKQASFSRRCCFIKGRVHHIVVQVGQRALGKRCSHPSYRQMEIGAAQCSMLRLLLHC